MLIKHSCRMANDYVFFLFFQRQWMLMYEFYDRIPTSFWYFKKIIPSRQYSKGFRPLAEVPFFVEIRDVAQMWLAVSRALQNVCRGTTRICITGQAGATSMSGYRPLSIRRHSVADPAFGSNPGWFERRYSPERLTHTPS